MEEELLHTYAKVDPLNVLTLSVRLSVLVAVTLTVPVVLFPVSNPMESVPHCYVTHTFHISNNKLEKYKTHIYR